MTDLTREDQAIDEARNELWYASNPKHNVTELEFTAFDCAWEACSAYKQKRITALERENARLKDERHKMTTRAANKQKRITELEDVLKKIWKISSNRRGVRVLIDKVLPEGGGDEMISPKGIITSKKAYDRFHAEGGGE